jgi:N-methylhydantoinase B
MYVISGGGYGGSPAGDGISNGCSTIGISRTTPVEVMEQHYPVLFEEYSLREGSGGAGKMRGGFGVNYVVRLRRGEARASMVMDHGRVGPQGVAGGQDGEVNQIAIETKSGRYRPPHLSKDQDIRLEAGDVIRVSTPGGGGFGHPHERDPVRVSQDVARGYYTKEQALERFAVVLDDDGEVDLPATAGLRGARG